MVEVGLIDPHNQEVAGVGISQFATIWTVVEVWKIRKTRWITYGGTKNSWDIVKDITARVNVPMIIGCWEKVFLKDTNKGPDWDYLYNKDR